MLLVCIGALRTCDHISYSTGVFCLYYRLALYLFVIFLFAPRGSKFLWRAALTCWATAEARRLIFSGELSTNCVVWFLYHFIYSLLSFTARGLCLCVLDYAFSNATAIQESTLTPIEFHRNVGHRGGRERQQREEDIFCSPPPITCFFQ